MTCIFYSSVILRKHTPLFHDLNIFTFIILNVVKYNAQYTKVAMVII